MWRRRRVDRRRGRSNAAKVVLEEERGHELLHEFVRLLERCRHLPTHASHTITEMQYLGLDSRVGSGEAEVTWLWLVVLIKMWVVAYFF